MRLSLFLVALIPAVSARPTATAASEVIKANDAATLLPPDSTEVAGIPDFTIQEFSKPGKNGSKALDVGNSTKKLTTAKYSNATKYSNKTTDELDELKRAASLTLIAGMTQKLLGNVNSLAQLTGTHLDELVNLPEESSKKEKRGDEEEEEGTWHDLVENVIGTIDITALGLEGVSEKRTPEEVNRLTDSLKKYLSSKDTN